MPNLDPNLAAAIHQFLTGQSPQGFGGGGFGTQPPAPPQTGAAAMPMPENIDPEVIKQVFRLNNEFQHANDARTARDAAVKRLEKKADHSQHYGEYGGWARALGDVAENFAQAREAQRREQAATQAGDTANDAATAAAPGFFNQLHPVPQGSASIATPNQYGGVASQLRRPQVPGMYDPNDPNSLYPFSLPG